MEKQNPLKKLSAKLKEQLGKIFRPLKVACQKMKERVQGVLAKVKSALSDLKKRIPVPQWLSALTILVKMQLKEKMDLGYMRSKKKTLFKFIWLIIEFAAITVIFYFAFYFLKLLGIFSLVHDIPVSVISILFTMMLVFSLVSDTLGLMKSLYFSNDNTVLLTFPATPSLVFFSKLVTYYIYELRKRFMYFVPMFLAFGITKGYATYYYPWLLFMFLLISTVPVLLAGLLSIPAMFVQIFLNRVKVVRYALYAVLAGGAVALLWFAIGLIPEDINFIETWGNTFWEIQGFLNDYTRILYPMYAFTELIVGKTIGLTNVIFHSQTAATLFIVIGIAVGLLLLCFLCSKPLFCRMASTPFEFKKKNDVKEKKNRQLPPFLSAIYKEFKLGIRSNYFVRLTAILLVAMPMAIELLNKIYSAMNTRFLGAQMTVCFSVLITLLIMLLTNIDIASVYSRDGSSSYLNKIQPTSYASLLFSKLVFPMIFALLGNVITMIVYSRYSTMPVADTVMLGVAVYSTYLIHLFSSAESDIMNPQHKQYALFNEQANNPNETSSGLLGVILPVIIFVAALFLSSRSTSGTWVKLGIALLVGAAFKAVTYLMKIKAFYKELQ